MDAPYHMYSEPRSQRRHMRGRSALLCCSLAAAAAGLLALSLDDGESGPASLLWKPLATNLGIKLEPLDVAYIIIIRHGEKPPKGEHDNGLSPDGASRARYLQRCIASPYASIAFPLGAPTYVMASHGKKGRSHRPQDTARPVAEALGLRLDDDVLAPGREAGAAGGRVHGAAV